MLTRLFEVMSINCKVGLSRRLRLANHDSTHRQLVSEYSGLLPVHVDRKVLKGYRDYKVIRVHKVIRDHKAIPAHPVKMDNVG